VKALVTGQGVPAAILTVAIVLLAPLLRSALLLLRPDGLALTLDRDGFTIHYLLRRRTFAWSEVADFTAFKSRAFELTIFQRSIAQQGRDRRLAVKIAQVAAWTR